MPPPFSVRSGADPGTDHGSWDATGSITLPGNLTVEGTSSLGGVNLAAGSNLSVPGTISSGGNATFNGFTAMQSAQTAGNLDVYGAELTAHNGLTVAGVLSSPIGAVAAPVNLTFGTTVATNAALGSYFRCTLSGNFTLANPTNGVDGQACVWELVQDTTGSRLLTLGSAFALGTTISSVTLTTTASKRDFLGAVYNADAGKWFVISLAQGY